MRPKYILYDGTRVLTEDYAVAKRKALVEFGYDSLTLEHVREQIEHALAGHDMAHGLTIIGMMMKDKIKLEEVNGQTVLGRRDEKNTNY